MGEIHIKLEPDHMPKTVAELVEYLRTMACVDYDTGLRRMPNYTDDEVFNAAADLIEKLTGSEPPKANMRTVAELPMTAFADAVPQRDEFDGEQTILTYNADVGVWDLAFFASGEEFPDRWFGDTHWIDITRMWPGVIAQVASFTATTEGSDR